MSKREHGDIIKSIGSAQEYIKKAERTTDHGTREEYLLHSMAYSLQAIAYAMFNVVEIGVKPIKM